jgi:hypothetical protein
MNLSPRSGKPFVLNKGSEMKIYKVTWSDMYADELYVHWCATINEAIAKREAENKMLVEVHDQKPNASIEVVYFPTELEAVIKWLNEHHGEEVDYWKSERRAYIDKTQGE